MNFAPVCFILIAMPFAVADGVVPAGPAAASLAGTAKDCPAFWRGTLRAGTGDSSAFSITESSTGRSEWLSLGEKGKFAEVLGYDRTREILTLRMAGKEYAIRQATAAAADDGPDPVLTPKFVNASQVRITGLESLEKLSKARRKAVLKRLAAMVERFDNEAGAEIKEFEADVAKTPLDDEGRPRKGTTEDPATYTMALSVGVSAAPGMSVSVSIEDDEYTGGAHGMTAYTPLNFLGDSDSPAMPAELLSGDPATLSRLSALAARQLVSQGYEVGAHFKDGLTPNAENFSGLSLTTTGIRIRFGDYQVGPYADGPQTIDIPAAALNGVGSEKLLKLWAK